MVKESFSNEIKPENSQNKVTKAEQDPVDTENSGLDEIVPIK
jgi:hypothetical protein